jgi:hypothetical protein
MPWCCAHDRQHNPVYLREGQTGIHIAGFFSFKYRFCAFFYLVTLITAFHVAALAVELIVGDFGDFHKSARFLVPAPHALPGIMQALG